jgi:hypothetical protein
MERNRITDGTTNLQTGTSLFQYMLVTQTHTQGPDDTCKETCKLECHSGSPVRDEVFEEASISRK